MGSIAIANRSTASMGLSATFVLAETDGLTHGLNRTISPITGVGTSISQKFVSIDPLPGGTLTRPRTNHPTMTRAWMKRIHSTHRWKILPLCRSINWPLSSGTFSAILERLEAADEDLERHPVQIFGPGDLAHLASHLAETTHMLANQAHDMAAMSDLSD